MNAPDPLHWTLNSCFGASHSVWVHLGSFRNYMKLDAKQGELVQLMRKFLPRCHVGIFSTNAPNPPHWTLNSCFGALYGVWVHLGSFCYSMKLNAEQGELVQLMQKFVPRSHIRIYRNERTQSAPLDQTDNRWTHWTFGCIWDRFVTPWNSMQNRVNWCN